MFRKVFYTFIIIFIFLASHLCADVFYVSKAGNDSDDGTTWSASLLTISAALSKAADGDEVWVAAGTYIEGQTITVNAGISLYGGFAGTETELSERNIAGNQTIINGNKSYRCVVNYGSIVDGFSLTEGIANSGAGIQIYDGILSNCKIYSNTATQERRGVKSETSSINNCAINVNVIEGNGGGIFISRGNVSNCLIYANCGLTGSGIYADKANIRNCTIYGNKPLPGYDWCSSVNLEEDCTITNSIIWKTIKGYGLPYYKISAISYSCFEEAKNINGNIKANPCFINTEGDVSTWDLHLKNGSKCIDAGTTVSIPIADIDGNPRPGNDSKSDIGAYESPDEYVPGAEPQSKRLYVSPSGSNLDGKSWSTAYNTMNDAIDACDDSFTEIWVSAGSYPDGKYLMNPGRISLIAGFSGTETNISERDFLTNKSIIYSGANDSQRSNFGTIDGVYVEASASITGGGFVNLGILTNCFIYSSKSLAVGGGIYNIDGIVDNCEVYYCYVYKDSSLGYGGGIYTSKGVVSNCKIYYSSANSGGGIYNDNGIIDNCTIYGNKATSSDGGGIYSKGGTVKNCVVTNNTSVNYGGGISIQSGEISGCNIQSNRSYTGGGVYSENTSIQNCYIHHNTAIGGLSKGTETDIVSKSDIYSGIGNTNPLFMPGIEINSPDKSYPKRPPYIPPYIPPTSYAGGIYSTSSSISNCRIYQNSADKMGGILISSGVISNSLIYSNSTDDVSVCFLTSNSYMQNCTIYANSSTPSYGSVYISNSKVKNSIIWNNTSPNVTLNYPGAEISYSCFNEATGTSGTLNLDPQFINTTGNIALWDLSLRNTSPCIDTGTSVSLNYDIIGTERPQYSGWDMGAYEFFAALKGDVNEDRVIDKKDAAIIQYFLCGRIGLYAQQLSLADFNSDGKIDISDIVSLLEKINVKTHAKEKQNK